MLRVPSACVSMTAVHPDGGLSYLEHYCESVQSTYFEFLFLLPIMKWVRWVGGGVNTQGFVSVQ